VNCSPASVARYLGSRAVAGPWSIEGNDRRDFSGAVVIPALAEGVSLFATLASLAANPHELLQRFLVLVVVNHRPDADPADQADNRALLRRLATGDGVPPGLNLAWVDAAAPGRELPAKGGGVGLARKIGFDLTLARFDYRDAPILVSLDADTLVRPNYLEALTRHFAAAPQGGAVIPFAHQPGATPAEEAAIVRYELFLRHYVLGLSLAGSPYAYHTVGSALACTASAYVKAGGMNRRVAGEDFYFLQQLAKTSGVAQLRGTTVHPSPRPSGRTPFGTGRSVARLLAGERESVRFYPPEAFAILGRWLDLVAADQEEKESLQARAQELSPGLAEFLRVEGFDETWSRLRRQNRTRQPLLRAFHGWFDALRSLRLIHHLCASGHPRVEAEQAIPPLLRRCGAEPPADAAGQLQLLRALQDGVNFPPTTGASAAGAFLFSPYVV